MKTVTVSVPDDVYRAARARAAERGISVSDLVGDYLRSLSVEPSQFARLEALQREVQAEIEHFSAGGRLDRDEVHRRPVR